MIHRIASTLATFKTLTFTPGLNLLLADKSPGATDRQTRNSAGKSSIIEIIHFLLGSNCKPDSIFRGEKLIDEQFSMTFDLNGRKVTADRSGSASNCIMVNGDESAWPVRSKVDRSTGDNYLSNKEWQRVLGAEMFGIADDAESYGPSFRSMVSYFVRREGAGGFHDARFQSVKQLNWDLQINVSYLLGLDWELPRSLQRIRLKEKSLQTLRKESRSGILGDLVGRTGELRTRMTVAQKRVEGFKKELDEFQVLPEYHDLEKEASAAANETADLANQNTLDRERIEAIKGQLQSERTPQILDIQEMYREAEIVLSDLVVKRLADVERFHETIIRNRHIHLEGEINAAERRIEQRVERMRRLDARRREIMSVLDAHGAIDQMTRLQLELTRQQAEVEELKRRLELARQVDSRKTELTIERARVKQALTNDVDSHAEVLEKAIVLFEEFSQRISEHEGSLTVEVTDNGPEFAIQVEGGRSKGIKNMQVFCFDMMLATLWAAKKSGPGFLVHDSHLFDGMDSRQIAKAIEIGAEQSAKSGFQYLVTLNSDVLASAEFSDEFDVEPFLHSVRLSDATDTGGLFGMRL